MQQNTPEEWRDIADWEGRYQVSNYGHVRSMPRYIQQRNRWDQIILRSYEGRLIVPEITERGYRRIKLHRLGQTCRTSAHRLVAQTYIGPAPDARSQACHNDGNPANNWVGNIRWDSPAGNIADRVAHGRDFNANKTHCPRKHDLRPPNLKVRLFEETGHRSCLACSRANAYASKWNRLGRDIDAAALSDEHYWALMT